MLGLAPSILSGCLTLLRLRSQMHSTSQQAWPVLLLSHVP